MFFTWQKNHPKDGQSLKVCNSNNVKQEDHKKTIRNKAMTQITITIVRQDKKTMKNRVIAKRITTLV